MNKEFQADLATLSFPNRTMLYISEVAKRLEVDEQHVRNLITTRKLHAVDSGKGRRLWRIPVRSFERFVADRSSMNIT